MQDEFSNPKKQTANVTDKTDETNVDATLGATLNEPSNLATPGSSQVKPGDDQTDDQVKDKSKKKRLGKAARAKLAKERLVASAASQGAAIATPTRSQKRPANPDDTPPPTDRPLKKHKDVEDGLTVAQRTNPLTMVVASDNYPEIALTQGHLGRLRCAVREISDKLPPEQWPRFSDSFCRGGAIVLIAAEETSKAWFMNHQESLLPRVGDSLRAGGVELLQRYWRATAWVPNSSEIEEPAVTVLKRLGQFNPTLKTQGWKIYAVIKGDAKAGEQGEKGRTIVVGIPESQLAPLSALQYRPFYDLGRLLFRVNGPNSNKDQADRLPTATQVQQMETDVELEESKESNVPT